MKILLAVDGSKSSLDAVQCLIDHVDWYRELPRVELVTVHLPKLPGMGAAVGKGQLEKYYEQEGEAQLAAAKKKLDAAKVHRHVRQNRSGQGCSARRRRRSCISLTSRSCW